MQVIQGHFVNFVFIKKVIVSYFFHNFYTGKANHMQGYKGIEY